MTKISSILWGLRQRVIWYKYRCLILINSRITCNIYISAIYLTIEFIYILNKLQTMPSRVKIARSETYFQEQGHR